jgi:hypothetical protein
MSRKKQKTLGSTEEASVVFALLGRPHFRYAVVTVKQCTHFPEVPPGDLQYCSQRITTILPRSLPPTVHFSFTFTQFPCAIQHRGT